MGPQRRFEKGFEAIEAILTERDRAKSFWNDFGAYILYQLGKDVPICNYTSIEDGIVLEQVRYRERGDDKTYTKWLREPLSKSEELVCG